MQIADKYSPQEIESKWYDYWIEKRLFHSEPDQREPYTIVIPPPNVTGMLHMGHMLNNTLQDVLVRRARMSGRNACWVPGMDHASIATEAKVVEGLADGIVEVTETGTTIRAHGLRIIDEVMVSYPVLIANKEAWEDPRKRAKIEQLTLLLQGALRAENLVPIKMNAPAAHLDAILEMLPSLNSPTVSPLRDGRWLSVETVVEIGIVRDLIPRLREAGAEGIIEYALNKVI